MELMGTFEVARLAGVSAQAVSNWMVRRADFPTPMAQLASGPVWDGAVMRRWLIRNGLMVGNDSASAEMDSFAVGREYTLAEIRAVLGGETMSYLPQRGSRIVCGRFTTGMNPDAPEKVLVGDPPKVQRKAELLAQQRGILPIFMKMGPGRWRYHGPMEFVEYVTDRAAVERAAVRAGRAGEVVGMLKFRAIKGEPQ
jgi:hypothetical protein